MITIDISTILGLVMIGIGCWILPEKTTRLLIGILLLVFGIQLVSC